MKTKIVEADYDAIKEDLHNLKNELLLVVVDSRVWQLYKKNFEDHFPANKKVHLYKALEGEGTKTVSEFERGCDFFLEKGIHRDAHIVAIGGGAVSDYAGFLASSLLRGLSWSVIPTTLLSMVDASIGGKTGLNSTHGKNLIGSFNLPQNVWLNPIFLETLPKDELQSGKGEIIKYAFLDEKIAKSIDSRKELKEIIRQCALKKEEIVNKDFKEQGERVCLNLGHTFGHALEFIYDLPHGVAVFWGMCLILKLFGKEDLLKDLRRYESALEADFGQAPWLNKTFPVAKIMELTSKDKKRKEGGLLELVLIEKTGTFVTQKMTLDDIEKLLEDKKDELRTIDF